MKTNFICAIAGLTAFTALSSCSGKPKSACVIDSSVSMAVKPNKMERIEKSIENFTALELDGAFTVFLSSGEKSKIIIETTPSCEKEMTVVVKNGVLKIGMTSDVYPSNSPKINIYLTSKEYKKIVSNGACVINSKNKLVQDLLEIEANGASEFDLDLTTKETKIDVHGASELKLKGNTEKLSVLTSGASTVLAFAFIADNVNIETNGAGEAEVFANKTLTVSNSGAGSVLYKGAVSDVKIENDGVGEVKKR